MPFKFTYTYKATEKEQFDQLEAEPEDFIRNLISRGHSIGEKDGPGIIAATFEAGGRLEGKFVDSVTGIILDIDGKMRRNGELVHEAVDPDVFLTKLPFLGVAHSSYNHTPDMPKFRVILPLKEPVSRLDHFRLWHWVNQLTEFKIDPACKNPDRMFYLPRCPKESAFQKYPWVRQLFGPLLDISAVPSSFQVSENFSYEKPTHRKQGMHVAPRESYRVNYDLERAFESFMSLPLVKWALEHPSDLSREVWRGIATNLAAVVQDHPEGQEKACELFHAISEPDPLRYNRSVTQKTFLDAIKSAKTYGPMTYAKMIENGAPTSIWTDKDVKSPISHARRVARVQEKSSPKTAAPEVCAEVSTPTSGATPEIQPKAPVKSAATPPSPPRPKFVDLDDEDDDDVDGDMSDALLSVMGPNADDYAYIQDENRWRLRAPNGSWSGPLVGDAITHNLMTKGLFGKKQNKFKATIRACITAQNIYASKDAIVSTPEGYVFNTFKPGELVPLNGEWPDIKLLMQNLVANDPAACEYVLDWLAVPIQSLIRNDAHRPKQMGSALVFMGDPGSGKGTLTLIMQLIYGLKNVAILSQDSLDSRFTSDLKDKLFVVANEVMSSTNRSLETANKLKPWITDPTIVVEQKGKDREVIKNNCNIIFTSNDERPVLIERHDRRFSVFHSKALDRAVSNRIYLDIAGDKTQLRAFYYDLLYRETKIEFGQLHENAEREKIIRASMGSEEKFILELVEDGWLAMSQPWVASSNPTSPREACVPNTHFVLASTLREVYVDWCRRNAMKSRSPAQFGTALRLIIPGIEDKRANVSGYQVRVWSGLPMQPKTPEISPTPGPPPPTPIRPDLKPVPKSDDVDFGAAK